MEGRGTGLGKEPGRGRKGEAMTKDRRGVRECLRVRDSKTGSDMKTKKQRQSERRGREKRHIL